MAETLAYIQRKSLIHDLTGATKFLFFIMWSVAAMITYDTRILLALFAIGIFLFSISKLKWKEVRFALIFMFVLLFI